MVEPNTPNCLQNTDDKGKGKVEGDLANQVEQAGIGDAISIFTSLDLKNRITKLEGDLARANQLVKAKKAKEPKEVPKEVIKVSTGQDVVCFNDVNYPLEIRMLKDTPRR
ncbi:hypothetical protein Tco_1003170 [Tanacetum coccineum]|uniref:Uncharacterized protein n=1 Tax=Tanacetum coccineum TaxID=301880 RepID=A0ABQ5FA77_9ASTR